MVAEMTRAPRKTARRPLNMAMLVVHNARRPELELHHAASATYCYHMLTNMLMCERVWTQLKRP